MANRSYLDLEDELKSSDDDSPYGNISSRGPLQESGMPATLGMPPAVRANDAIKQAILKRSTDKLSNPLTVPGDPSVAPAAGDANADPYMKQFNESQGKLDEYRKAKAQADYISNLGQSFSALASGGSAPKDMSGLYANIGKQNQEMVSGAETDEARRAKVMEAIEGRKSREAMAADTIQARRDVAKMHGQDLAARAADRSAMKDEAQANKWAIQMKDDLDPNKARGGNLALNQKRVDNADRVQGLLAQVNSNPDPRQMEELAISTQALLSSSGSPAAEQVKALIPHTAMGSAMAFKEWLTNNPQGTGQQEFVKRMAETVTREKEIAQNQVRKAQQQRLSAYGKFKDIDPDTYSAILNSYGLNEDHGSSSKGAGGLSVEQEKNISANAPVRMQAPDGRVRLVPADQVDAAMAAGGKKI